MSAGASQMTLSPIRSCADPGGAFWSATTGIGAKELGAAIAKKGALAGPNPFADEVATSLTKLPPAQQAKLARVLLASEQATQWAALARLLPHTDVYHFYFGLTLIPKSLQFPLLRAGIATGPKAKSSRET